MTGSQSAAPFRTTLQPVLEHRVAGLGLGMGPLGSPWTTPQAACKVTQGRQPTDSIGWRPQSVSPLHSALGGGARACPWAAPLTLDRPSRCLGPAALGCQHACPGRPAARAESVDGR